MNQSSMRWLAPCGFAICLLQAGCWRTAQHEVVVYSALDAEFSAPILDKYAQQTHVTVRPNFDVESTKTVGLVTRLIRERDRPRCDLFWNNEILHTLRLRRLGMLVPYESAAGKKLPASYRSPQGYWYGFAARARVLVVNTNLVAADQRPESIMDLVRPKWKNRAGIAKPLFGTTATHAAVLFTHWGGDRARLFFEQVKRNVRVMSGNRQVAIAVGRGELAFGLTDTDDALLEKEHGSPVDIIYPDQQPNEMGTLFIPNTVCIIKGSPHPREARRLVEYLLGPEVETMLARGPSGQFPVNPEVTTTSRAAPPQDIRWMKVDFQAAAEQWDEAATFLQQLFTAVP